MELKAYENGSALDIALADSVAAQLRSTVATEGEAWLVVSGGRTPLGFFCELSQIQLPWEKVVVTLADERWVAADHADSNEKLVRENLLINESAKARFVSLKAEFADAEQGVEEVEQRLALAPRFAVVILGMGDDGHTASLFPGSPVLEERKAWVAHAEGGAPSLGRVTLTLPVLNNAFRVIFLASGEEKAEILRAVLQGEGTGSLPAARVSPRQGRVTWLVDSTAASALPSRGSSPPGNGGDPA